MAQRRPKVLSSYALVQMTGPVEVTSQQLVMWIMIPGGIGYVLPKYWVTRRKQMRQEAITNGFPDSLDMMLVCVEAGQSSKACSKA